MQLDFFESQPTEQTAMIALEDLFEAYYQCRATKRRTVNALAFELDFEREIIRLWREINAGLYKIGRSIAFIIKKPVQREVFAADFRDRVVHHLIINKINDLFEKEFVSSSYSCRKGRGTLYGVRDIAEDIESCSDGYSKDCYIMKLDIRSFFMSIDKRILYRTLEKFLQQKYRAPDKPIILKLVKQIIFYSPENNCVIKGQRSDWNGLPYQKSLFWSEKYCGLPIGNLTSQVFANFYLNFLDQYITKELKIPYYGRYVDDFVMIHRDKQILLDAREKIRVFLQAKLNLTLHPKKFYLQHYQKGVQFIGAFIKPEHIYVGRRTKANLYEKIYTMLPEMAQSVENTLSKLPDLTSSINSYLGFMRHYNTYCLRERVLKLLDSTFLHEVIDMPKHAEKLAINKLFRQHNCKKRQLRKQRQYRRFHNRLDNQGEANGFVHAVTDLS